MGITSSPTCPSNRGRWEVGGKKSGTRAGATQYRREKERREIERGRERK